MVPQWVQPPPTASWASITAIRWPALASFMAAPSPAGPVPMTIQSSSRMAMPLIRAPAGYRAPRGALAGHGDRLTRGRRLFLMLGMNAAICTGAAMPAL